MQTATNNIASDDETSHHRSATLAYACHVVLSPILAGLAGLLVRLIQSGYSGHVAGNWFVGEFLFQVGPVSVVNCAVIVWLLRRRPLLRLAGMLVSAGFAVLTNELFPLARVVS